MHLSKAPNYAVRLNRFKPFADTWKQRRVEEAFAVYAAAYNKSQRKIARKVTR